jgi:hypothetical protein
LTSGGFFNQAFSTGVTVATAIAADGKTAVIDLSTYKKAAIVELKSADVATAASTQVLKGGSGDDNLTVTNTAYTGATNGVIVNGGAGNDTILVTTALATGNEAAIVITGGAGADAIKITTADDQGTTGVATFVVTGATDSTVTAYDSITGIHLGALTGAYAADVGNKADKIDLAGTATIQANASATASGVANVNYVIATGLLTFTGTGATDLTLAQKIEIANTATSTDGAYVVFTNGSNSYMFHQDVASGDQFIELVGCAVTGAATSATAVSGYIFAV